MHPKDVEGIANSVDWSGSALFAQTCLSENLGKLQYFTEVSEQPRGGTPALNVKAIRDRRHANVSKQRTLLADVDVAPPHGVA